MVDGLSLEIDCVLDLMGRGEMKIPDGGRDMVADTSAAELAIVRALCGLANV
jgi:hypothetical protein